MFDRRVLLDCGGEDFDLVIGRFQSWRRLNLVCNVGHGRLRREKRPSIAISRREQGQHLH